MVDAYYNHKKDLDLFSRDNTNWEENVDYVKKELIFFPENREEGYFWKPKN